MPEMIDFEVLREALISTLMETPAGADRTRLEILVSRVLDQAIAGHLESRLLLIRLILDSECNEIVQAAQLRSASKFDDAETALAAARCPH